MDVDTLVESYRRAVREHGHTRVELEFRFGKDRNGTFAPGVSRAEFEALEKLLDASPKFVKTTKDTLERLNGTDVRFIVTDGNEAAGVWQYKKKLSALTEKPGKGALSIRAALALEGTEGQAPPPGAPPFSYHRLKKRTSYRHACWSVDLTRVTSNLPNQFDSDEELYEVEVEFVGHGMLFAYTFDYIVRWGYQLMSELRDVCCKT